MRCQVGLQPSRVRVTLSLSQCTLWSMFVKKQQQQKAVCSSYLRSQLAVTSGLKFKLTLSEQGGVSKSGELAADVKECQPEWDGHPSDFTIY